MTFTSRKLDDSRVELSIDLNQNDLKKYIAEVEKRLASNFKLEGFRPGKVPSDIVRKHLGAEKISQEALSLAIQSSLADILEKEDLDVITYPIGSDFKIIENSPAKLSYQVILTVFPEIKLGKYVGLGIKKRPISVGEPEIKNVLRDLQELRIQRQNADRPAKLGDRVEVDFLITLEGKEINGGKSQNHPLILGKKAFIPGFEEQIVGMRIDENKKFTLKVPTGYYQENIAGKDIDIDLTLKKVESLSTPELNDNFAKKVGNFNNLHDLEKNIEQGLTMEKEAKEKERTRLEILNQIVVTSKFNAPPVLVEERLDGLIQEFDHELHQKGMELGPYLAHINKTQDDLRRDWRSKAELQVKMNLITRAIAKEENIKINNEEVTQKLAVLADHYAREGMLDDLQNTNPMIIKSRIHDALLSEKVFEFLDNSNVVG